MVIWKPTKPGGEWRKEVWLQETLICQRGDYVVGFGYEEITGKVTKLKSYAS